MQETDNFYWELFFVRNVFRRKHGNKQLYEFQITFIFIILYSLFTCLSVDSFVTYSLDSV